MKIDKEEILSNMISVNGNFKECGIYFLIKNEEVVYVGQTINGVSRIKQHKQDKDFDHYYFKQCQKNNLNKNEARYISIYNPKYNKSIPSIHKYYQSSIYGVLPKKVLDFLGLRYLWKTNGTEYYDKLEYESVVDNIEKTFGKIHKIPEDIPDSVFSTRGLLSDDDHENEYHRIEK